MNLRQTEPTCPGCGFAYYWEDTHPGQCDGCGHTEDDE